MLQLVATNSVEYPSGVLAIHRFTNVTIDISLENSGRECLIRENSPFESVLI